MSNVVQSTFTLYGQLVAHNWLLDLDRGRRAVERDEHAAAQVASVQKQVAAGYGSSWSPVVMNGFESTQADIDTRSVRELLAEVSDELWALRRERLWRDYATLTASFRRS
jgi:hypothetical protein